jgi:hypothetical protein
MAFLALLQRLRRRPGIVNAVAGCAVRPLYLRSGQHQLAVLARRKLFQLRGMASAA